MIKRLYTAFIIYMVMLYATPAYSINFFFSHLGVEDGLSQVSVLDISRIRTATSGSGHATEQTAMTGMNLSSIRMR